MKITTLVIEHECGVNIYPCASPELADAYLYDYVKRWWAREYGDDDPIPADPADAVEQYFEESDDEHYWFSTDAIIETLPTPEVPA